MKSAQPFVEGDRLFLEASASWDAGDNATAFTLFKKAAALGNVSAQHNLGYFYDEGVGVRKNKRLALRWYKSAWTRDQQSGTCANIARLYSEIGNRRRAMHWWTKAVGMGDGDAALDLAKLFLATAADEKRTKAVRLLKAAAKSAHITDDGKQEARALLTRLA